ncbi:MAG TPA: aldo/keto reductase [Candidatus Moranbacteria bacterium]|jgi:2,5-diketo-D-gluconate reductase A|nr:aldo/keto reductase [Candidatus Moranbacteria bacterium]HPX94770.1 aldo/keto reductase [Candidatus Moranbacteria bacterium]HQB59612.1 aldo/keto reductase [Candidatus Moranbacteria bacterium]
MDIESKINLRTGRRMPVMGLGTWQLTRDTAGTVRHAIDIGYRMIDTASDYGTQPAAGEAIRTSNVPREKLYIVTKIEEIDDAYEASKSYVKEMGLDYADLILIHRPPETGAGEDLWKGLIRARDEGIARDIGVSNYSMSLINELASATGEVPAVNQIEWSPFGHSMAMFSYCRENDIVIQAYSPLTRTDRLDDARLAQLAEKYKKSPAQLLLRWNLQLGTVPIPKANQKPHLEENIDIFDFEISEEDMEIFGSLNERYSALGALPYD